MVRRVLDVLVVVGPRDGARGVRSGAVGVQGTARCDRQGAGEAYQRYSKELEQKDGSAADHYIDGGQEEYG